MVYRRWTLHGFGHMLGLDVHDCANARKETYRDGTLGEGYVLTVEPGPVLPARGRAGPGGAARDRRPDRGRRPGHRDRRGQPVGRPAPHAPTRSRPGWPRSARPAPACPTVTQTPTNAIWRRSVDQLRILTRGHIGRRTSEVNNSRGRDNRDTRVIELPGEGRPGVGDHWPTDCAWYDGKPAYANIRPESVPAPTTMPL